MSVPYARFFTPPLRGGSFPLPRAKDVVKTSVFTRPLKRDSSTHSDRGVQYLSIRYTERLALAGIEPSVGSRGDSYDNALAETIIGLYKTELVYPRGPWSRLEDIELATLEWVWWFNNHRLLGPLGHVPPAEYEELCNSRQTAQTEPLTLKSNSLR